MIESYRSLAVFVAIAEAGSLSAAGRRLGLSTSVVSHHLSRLEARMGATLFFRSTRSMSLTAEGHAALEPARRMVSAGEEALDVIAAGSSDPVGALRIATPAFGEQSQLRHALWDFAKAHPLVSISLHTSDEPVDLIKEGFDLAFRLGVLQDSGLKRRRIGTFRRALVAAPSFLDAHGPVRAPEDLEDLPFLSVGRIPDAFDLLKGTDSVTVAPQRVQLHLNTVTSAKSAILAGLAIWHLPISESQAELSSGALVHVLPDWRLTEMGIFAVWPDAGPQKALTRRLIDHVSQRKGGLME